MATIGEGPATTEDLRAAQRVVEDAQATLAHEEKLEAEGNALLGLFKDHFSRYMTNNKHLELPPETTLGAYWRARSLFIQIKTGHDGARHFEPRLETGWPRPAVLFYRID